MSSGFTEAPPYSAERFEDREGFSKEIQGHYALLDHDDTLVKITDWVSNRYPCRRFEVVYNHGFGKFLGLPNQPFTHAEVREDALTPVDPSAPNWLAKAQAWRAERRSETLDQGLPPAVAPVPRRF